MSFIIHTSNIDNDNVMLLFAGDARIFCIAQHVEMIDVDQYWKIFDVNQHVKTICEEYETISICTTSNVRTLGV